MNTTILSFLTASSSLDLSSGVKVEVEKRRDDAHKLVMGTKLILCRLVVTTVSATNGLMICLVAITEIDGLDK